MADQDNVLEEAQLLFNERQLTIGDRDVTVREFAFLEGLRAQVLARPMLKDLRIHFESGDADPEDIALLMEGHAEEWLEICALASGEPAEWIAKLPSSQGEQLSLAVWEVCSDFFMRSLEKMLRIRLTVRAQAAAALATSSSSES